MPRIRTSQSSRPLDSGELTIAHQNVGSVSAVSTTSATFQPINDTAITITVAGTYIAVFTGSTELLGANPAGEMRLELDGSLIPNTTRAAKVNINLLGLITLDTSDLSSEISMSAVFTATVGQVVRPAFRELNNDVMFIRNRNLTIIRLGE